MTIYVVVNCYNNNRNLTDEKKILLNFTLCIFLTNYDIFCRFHEVKHDYIF